MCQTLESEDFLEGDGLHGTEGLEEVLVDVCRIAEYSVIVIVPVQPFFLEGLDILESHIADGFEDGLVFRLGNAQTAAGAVFFEDSQAGDALGAIKKLF